MIKFTASLAITALLANEAEALKSRNFMYDPMNLSQVKQTVSTAQAAAEPAPVAAPAPAAAAAPAAAPAAQPKTVAPAATATAAAPKAVAPAATATSNKAAKKSWCVDNVTMTFYNNKETPVEALDQFNTFVNTICPVLDIKVPNGVIVSTCFHTGYFLLRQLRPFADAKDKQNFDEFVDDFCDSYDEALPQ